MPLTQIRILCVQNRLGKIYRPGPKIEMKVMIQTKIEVYSKGNILHNIALIRLPNLSINLTWGIINDFYICRLSV